MSFSFAIPCIRDCEHFSTMTKQLRIVRVRTDCKLYSDLEEIKYIRRFKNDVYFYIKSVHTELTQYLILLIDINRINYNYKTFVRYVGIRNDDIKQIEITLSHT